MPDAPSLQLRIVIVVEIIDPDNFFTRINQRIRHCCADESGTTSNQSLHELSRTSQVTVQSLLAVCELKFGLVEGNGCVGNGERAVIDIWQNILGEKVALFEVWVARQNKG